MVEVEIRIHVICIGCVHKVWRLQIHSKPFGYSYTAKTIYTILIQRFINAHVYAEVLRMEVKLDGLLFKSKVCMGLTDHILNVVVD